MGFKGQKVSLSWKGFWDQKNAWYPDFLCQKLFYKSGKGPPTGTKMRENRGDHSAQCTRFFQNLSRFKVNGGIPSMHLCMVPFERALHLEVFGQVLVSPFEF